MVIRCIDCRLHVWYCSATQAIEAGWDVAPPASQFQTDGVCPDCKEQSEDGQRPTKAS